MDHSAKVQNVINGVPFVSVLDDDMIPHGWILMGTLHLGSSCKVTDHVKVLSRFNNET